METAKISFIKTHRLPIILIACLALASLVVAWRWRLAIRPVVSGSLTLTKSEYAFGEPIEAQLTLENISRETLYSAMQYPDRLGLTFTPRPTQGHIQKRPNPYDGAPIAMSILMRPLKAGEVYSKKVYLNRYLIFKEPGVSQVDCNLWLAFYTKDAKGRLSKSYRELKTDSVLTISLQKTDSKTLDALLATKAKGLQTRGNVRDEAIEALTFLDTRLAPRYWKQMLKMPGPELAAIGALADFEHGKHAAMVTEALPNPNSDVVRAALGVLGRHSIVLDDAKIESMVSTNYRGDDVAKLYLVEYLGRHGSSRHMFILRRLQNDPDTSIAREATNVLRKVAAREKKPASMADAT